MSLTDLNGVQIGGGKQTAEGGRKAKTQKGWELSGRENSFALSKIRVSRFEGGGLWTLRESYCFCLSIAFNYEEHVSTRLFLCKRLPSLRNEQDALQD